MAARIDLALKLPDSILFEDGATIGAGLATYRMTAMRTNDRVFLNYI